MKFAGTVSALALAIGSVAIPSAAFAQDADTADLATDEDGNAIDSLTVIVVTGAKTKDPEDVQDVPFAVTAFNAESLDALKVRDVQSLTYSAPNVSLDQIGTSRGTANFSIRGLGINSSIPSIDPTVGVFVDGVYLGFNGGVVFDLFDLDSVEILRGPQGVLFGRNVTGGAVLINTGNPTDDFQGKVRAAIEGPLLDGGRGVANTTISGVVSGPIAEDTLLFKLGAYYNKDDGYFTNQFDGSNHGAAETTILRGALEFRPTPELTLVGKLDWFDSEGDGPSAQNRGQFDRNTFDFAIDNPGSYSSEILTASLRTDWELGPGILTNIFGYRDYSATTDADIDALPLFIFHSDTETEQEQLSTELRYAMSFDTIDLTVGGFYFDQAIAYTENRLIPSAPAAFWGGGRQDHQVLGLFANSEIGLTDRLSLIAGLRWSREEKDAAITYVRPRPTCSVVQSTCPVGGTNPLIPTENNGFTDKDSWGNWSPKFGLQYEFDAGQLYAHWTRGYRSGGYNFRITNANAFEAIAAANGSFSFDEERVDSYEIGGKFETVNGELVLNLAAYVTEVDNMQREVNQSSITAGVAQSIFNTADASIFGLEAEGRFRVFDSLLLTGNIGYIDAAYSRVLFDISGDGVVDASDANLRLPRVPELTWGVGLIHELELDSSTILSRINLQYRDEFAYTDNNFGFIQEATNLDANITWKTPIEGLSFSIYGKNLLDEVQAGGDTQLPFGTGAFSNGANQPFDPSPAAGTFSPLSKGRQVGAEATFAF